MRHYPHRPDIEYPPPNVVTGPSPAPAVVVECWCIGVQRMDRPALDAFTRDIWKRFDHRNLEPLKRAILRRREELAARG